MKKLIDSMLIKCIADDIRSDVIYLNETSNYAISFTPLSETTFGGYVIHRADDGTISYTNWRVDAHGEFHSEIVVGEHGHVILIIREYIQQILSQFGYSETNDRSLIRQSILCVSPIAVLMIESAVDYIYDVHINAPDPVLTIDDDRTSELLSLFITNRIEQLTELKSSLK